MIKDGRPYSVENGTVDDALITSHSADDIEAVEEWIRANIRHAKRILHGRTSYGLKHILTHDTGIYLTNNEFKDAMLLAGFKPVNPNELNWRYRITLTSETNHNPSPFFKWALQFKDEDSPYGDFAKDMERDFRFPVLANKYIIEMYLHRVNACKGAFEAFEEMWSAYAGKAN